VGEQSIAELKQGPLAHLPSGDFWANAAWLTLAAMTINMGRAIATLAGHGLGEATLGTLQRTLLAVPARLASSARPLPPAPAPGHRLALADRPHLAQAPHRLPPPDHLSAGHPPDSSPPEDPEHTHPAPSRPHPDIQRHKISSTLI